MLVTGTALADLRGRDTSYKEMGSSTHPEALRSRTGPEGTAMLLAPKLCLWSDELLDQDFLAGCPRNPVVFRHVAEPSSSTFHVRSFLFGLSPLGSMEAQSQTHLEQTLLPLAFYLSLAIQLSLFLPLSKIPTREGGVGRKNGEKTKENPPWFGQILKISSVAKR